MTAVVEWLSNLSVVLTNILCTYKAYCKSYWDHVTVVVASFFSVSSSVPATKQWHLHQAKRVRQHPLMRQHLPTQAALSFSFLKPRQQVV